MAVTPARGAPDAGRRRRGRATALAGAALLALLGGLYARTFVVFAVRVPSGSMSPALEPGDVLLVDRLAFARGPLAALLPAREPRVGEVLVVRSPEARSRLLVKRCAAVAGGRFAGALVPAGTVALAGDDPARSHDSRSFGPVGRSAVVGRAALVVWSLDRDGGVRLRWRRILAPVR